MGDYNNIVAGLVPPLFVGLITVMFSLYTDVQALNKIAYERVKEIRANEKEFKLRLTAMEREIFILQQGK